MEMAANMPKTIAVLLVEDNEDDAVLIERYLKAGGFAPAVRRVDNKEAMTAAFADQRWDVIICDHNMPRFNAPAALDVLKQLQLDIPFIIVSGTIDMDVAVAAMKAGAQDFVEKSNLARLCPAVSRELKDARDRRKRREAERSLRDREQTMRLVLDQTPIILWSTGSDLRYTSFLGRISERAGFQEADMLGQIVTGPVFTNGVDTHGTQDIMTYLERVLRGESAECDFGFADMIWHAHVEPLYDETKNVIGTIGISYDITEATQQREELEESERRLRYLSHRLLVAQEDERKRVAREIHDSVGQSLAAIKIRTQNVMNRIATNAPRTPATSLEAVLPVIQQTIIDVKRLQRDLHPAILDDFGIVAAIKSFAKNYRVTYPDIKVVTRLKVDEPDVPTALRPALFRIMQESMNNVAKHSGCDSLSIYLGKRKHTLVLEVTDNGCGFDFHQTQIESIQRGALGFVSMRERVQLSNGTFDVRSAAGEGTTITAAWPIGS